MIIKLYPQLINKIAAGEVVERPASVVKELIENSIDAKATKILVDIEKSGLHLIRVVDNGTGMDREDALLACESHTTSKIASIQDLDNIVSMGFRGEALSSIASVSDFEMITKDKTSKTGTKIEIKYGKFQKAEDISSNIGTSISVKHLFHNVPARKKFLKSERTEYANILDTFLKYALSFPSIHFLLTHNNNSVYNLPSITSEDFNKELLLRIDDIFSNEISENLVEINYNSPRINILGYIGHPKISRSSKAYQYIFLNNRPIIDKIISKAVYDAFTGLMPKDRYPIFFIFLNINPNEVDVNVHPRKSEVRFQDPNFIYRSVNEASKRNILKFLQKDTQEALKKYSKFAVNIKKKLKNMYPKLQKSFEIEKSIIFTKELLKSPKQNVTYTRDETYNFYSKSIPSNQVIQIFESYIICILEDKIVLIDQHAASERVTYEKLKKQIDSNAIETQRVLFSENIDLDPSKFEVFMENRKNLEKLGIKLSLFGKNSVKVDEIPAILAKSDFEKLIFDLLDELQENTGIRLDKFNKIKEKLIATMACHTSIRGNMKLTQDEMNYLINELFLCENQYSCPHGRPILWEISKDEIEKKFKRK